MDWQLAEEALVGLSGFAVSLFVIVRFLKSDRVWREQNGELRDINKQLLADLAQERVDNEALFDENRKWRIRIVALEVWIRSNGGDPAEINGPAGQPLTDP